MDEAQLARAPLNGKRMTTCQPLKPTNIIYSLFASVSTFQQIYWTISYCSSLQTQRAATFFWEFGMGTK